MSNASQRQARLSSAGALIAPLAAVALIRIAGPQQSVAATSMQTTEAPGLPAMPSSESRHTGVIASAAGYAQRLFESGFSGTPFPQSEQRSGMSDTPLDPAIPDEPLTDRTANAPDIRISAIMARRDGAIAVIDARIRPVGSQVAPGWTLDSIDEPNRTLVIRHRSGRRVELTLSTP